MHSTMTVPFKWIAIGFLDMRRDTADDDWRFHVADDAQWDVRFRGDGRR